MLSIMRKHRPRMYQCSCCSFDRNEGVGAQKVNCPVWRYDWRRSDPAREVEDPLFSTVCIESVKVGSTSNIDRSVRAERRRSKLATLLKTPFHRAIGRQRVEIRDRA